MFRDSDWMQKERVWVPGSAKTEQEQEIVEQIENASAFAFVWK